MLNASDIARGVQGALRFLQRDPGAPYYFANTFEQCLASFRVMMLAAPLYGLYIWLYYSRVETTADALEIAGVEAMHFVVDWLLFPVLFYEIARRRQWLDRYPRYISALNWINLPVLLLAVAMAHAAKAKTKVHTLRVHTHQSLHGAGNQGDKEKQAEQEVVKLFAPRSRRGRAVP